MTAEIFLTSFLGCWLAIIVTSVLLRTVYVPLQGWLVRRAFKRAAGDVTAGADHIVPADYVPCPLESPEEQATSHRMFEAQSELCLAALDVTDDIQADGANRVIAAALAFRHATTPGRRKQMRAMEAFRKAQHAPDDPV